MIGLFPARALVAFLWMLSNHQRPSWSTLSFSNIFVDAKNMPPVGQLLDGIGTTMMIVVFGEVERH